MGFFEVPFNALTVKVDFGVENFSGFATKQNLAGNFLRFQITMRTRLDMYTYKFAFQILLCSLLFCLALGASASPKYTLVEVWCGGDDGQVLYTIKFSSDDKHN